MYHEGSLKVVEKAMFISLIPLHLPLVGSWVAVQNAADSHFYEMLLSEAILASSCVVVRTSSFQELCLPFGAT